MKGFIKKLIISLLIASLIKVYTTLFPSPTIYHWLSLLFVILLFYYLFLPLIYKFSDFFSEIRKKHYPYIGILNGNISSPLREYKCQRAWTEVTSSMWFSGLKNAIKDKKLQKIKMIPVLEISNKFSIIINPFGDNFPEEDTKLHKTFYRICEYIKNGGIFLCTGGAFWAHQNTKISEKSDWALKNIEEGGQNLKYSFLYFDFGIEPTGGDPKEVNCYQKDEDKLYCGELLTETTKIKLFRAITDNTSDYIPIIREKDNKSFPIALIRYGNGFLIHAGMHLTSAESIEFKLLIQIIKSLVFNKFKNF